jgi:uncharacterized protein (TIGR02996 family)
MTVQNDLIAAIDAEPDDENNPLVLADVLQANGDERGELIVLDHHERVLPDGLTDFAAVERLLLLAALYGFPHAREARHPPLAFIRQYEFWQASARTYYAQTYYVNHGGHGYTLVFRHHVLTISVDGRDIDRREFPDGLALATANDGDLTDDEIAIVFEIVSDAIRAGTPLSELCYPFGPGALPYYPGAPRRVYEIPRKFRAKRGLARESVGLAACDYHRWHAIRKRPRRK